MLHPYTTIAKRSSGAGSCLMRRDDRQLCSAPTAIRRCDIERRGMAPTAILTLTPLPLSRAEVRLVQW